MNAPEDERKITTKDELIDEFVSSRAEVFEALEGLTDEDMTLPMDDSGMTIKKLLIHWIAWDGLEIGRTGKYFAKQEISMEPDKDPDAFNNEAFLKWEDRSIQEAREAFYKSTKRVENFLRGFTQQQLFTDARGMRFNEQKEDGSVIVHVVNPAWFLVEADHDRGHAREIEQWKRELGTDEHQHTT